MTKTDLEALAVRVEGLSGPDREVDACIAAALRITPGTPGTEWMKAWEGLFIANPASHGEPGRVALQNGCWWRANDFTASVDIALSLIPSGWRYMLDARPGHEGRADGYRMVVYRSPERPFEHAKDSWCAKPALAVVAQALRARASLIEEG